jgi:rhodanese-related sulfurtransferase
LKIPGQLEGELLLLDFTNFSSATLKARRHSECAAPGCARIRNLPGEEPELQVEFPSLAAAVALGLQVIDIRNPDEFAARPTLGWHIPMPTLLANPLLLPPGSQYLLVCASGKRSLSVARELHKRGHKVRSLTGGLEGLGH